MQMLTSHTSSTKSEILSFNIPPSDADVCLRVRTTGLNYTKLIINDFLLYKKDDSGYVALQLTLNTVSKEKF